MLLKNHLKHIALPISKCFLLIIITLHSLAFFSQEIDCSNFKKGKYFYTPPNGGEVWIKRTKHKQIEKYNDEHQRFIFKITWEEPCKYTLVLQKTKGVSRKIKKEILGTTLECSVLKAELDHYLVKIHSSSKHSTEIITIYME